MSETPAVVKKCSFCNKVHDKMVQSPVEESAVICGDCIYWFKDMVDVEKLSDFNKKYRPDDSQRGD